MKIKPSWYAVFNLNFWSHCPNLFKVVTLWWKSVECAIISNTANTIERSQMLFWMLKHMNYGKCLWQINNSMQEKKTEAPDNHLNSAETKKKKREEPHLELNRPQQKFSFVLYCCLHSTTINLVKCTVYIQNKMHFPLCWMKNFLNKNSHVLLFPMENKLQCPYPWWHYS